MKWRDLFTGRKGGLERIEEHLLDMLDADRHTFALATSGLFGAGDLATLRQQASDSDHRVNLLVQQVRRELVVHAALRGAERDIRTTFATMSIVKDIERIGDYAKQMLRLARVRGPFASGSATHTELTAYCGRISGYLTEARDALRAYDSDGARALIAGIHGLTDELGAATAALLVADPAPGDGAARALAYHYLARICSHLSNVLTSLVMPLDKLDFYDEQHPDRPDDAG